MPYLEQESDLYMGTRMIKLEGIYDVHCHILPGVDDGAGDMETAVQMLRMEYQDGVKTIILTPHYRRRMFEPKMEDILRGFEVLKGRAREFGIDLYLGCEYHVNMDMVTVLEEGKRPTMAGSRYVLCEFSEGDTPSYIKERVYHLISHGYIPILAHIERYAALRKDLLLVEDLSELGCLTQVNAGSILGDDGFLVKRFCKKLMDYDLLDLVGSDAHDLKNRIPRMGACAEYLIKKEGKAYAEKILCENPARILW